MGSVFSRERGPNLELLEQRNLSNGFCSVASCVCIRKLLLYEGLFSDLSVGIVILCAESLCRVDGTLGLPAC